MRNYLFRIHMYKTTSKYNTIGVSVLMIIAGMGPVSISCSARSCDDTLSSHVRQIVLGQLDHPSHT